MVSSRANRIVDSASCQIKAAKKAPAVSPGINPKVLPASHSAKTELPSMTKDHIHPLSCGRSSAVSIWREATSVATTLATKIGIRQMLEIDQMSVTAPKLSTSVGSKDPNAAKL